MKKAPQGCDSCYLRASLCLLVRLHSAQILFASTLNRRSNSQLLAIFCYRPPGDVYAVALQHVDDRVVGQNFARTFRVDDSLDPMTNGFGRERGSAVGALDRGGEKVFQLEQTAGRRDVFVVGDAADRAL